MLATAWLLVKIQLKMPLPDFNRSMNVDDIFSRMRHVAACVKQLVLEVHLGVTLFCNTGGRTCQRW